MRIHVNKEDVKKFNESDIGKVKNTYLKRSTIIGIILVMVSFIYLIYDIFNEGQLLDYIISGTVFVFGLYFIINSNRIKKIEVNKYIYEKKNKVSKK